MRMVKGKRVSMHGRIPHGSLPFLRIGWGAVQDYAGLDATCGVSDLGSVALLAVSKVRFHISIYDEAVLGSG